MQHAGGPLVGPRRQHQQVGGHALGRGAGLGQQPRRALVVQLALARRELLVDRVPDQRVHEAQRRLGAQDLGPGQRRVASATASASSPVWAATVGTSAAAPSTATARATWTVSGASRARRINTVRDTARGPTSSTRSTWEASGSTPSERSADTSWPRSSGLPPVAFWQAAAKRSSGSRPSPALTNSRPAAGLSGCGRTAWPTDRR